MPSSQSRFAIIPARFAMVMFSFYMAAIMAFLMSICLVAINTGMNDGFIWRVIKSYGVAMPIAFCCVLLVRPLVVKLVSWTVKTPNWLPLMMLVGNNRNISPKHTINDKTTIFVFLVVHLHGNHIKQTTTIKQPIKVYKIGVFKSVWNFYFKWIRLAEGNQWEN